MNCTFPNIFGFREWFEARFKDLCDEHDLHYVLRDVPKTLADAIVSVKIAKKNWRYIPLGIAAFIVLIISPRAYSLWYKDELGIWRW